MFYNQGKYGKLKHIKIMGGLPMDKEEVVSKNFIEKRYLCILFSCGVPFLCYCDNTFSYKLIICLALLSHDSSS